MTPRSTAGSGSAVPGAGSRRSTAVSPAGSQASGSTRAVRRVNPPAPGTSTGTAAARAGGACPRGRSSAASTTWAQVRIRPPGRTTPPPATAPWRVGIRTCHVGRESGAGVRGWEGEATVARSLSAVVQGVRFGWLLIVPAVVVNTLCRDSATEKSQVGEVRATRGRLPAVTERLSKGGSGGGERAFVRRDQNGVSPGPTRCAGAVPRSRAGPTGTCTPAPSRHGAAFGVDADATVRTGGGRTHRHLGRAGPVRRLIGPASPRSCPRHETHGRDGAGHPRVGIDFHRRYSSSPSGPNSLPTPLALRPPNGVFTSML